MTHTINRGIGYSVERLSTGAVRVYLPFIDPMDKDVLKFRAPSVLVPADAIPADTKFDDMSDADVVAWVRSHIAG